MKMAKLDTNNWISVNDRLPPDGNFLVYGYTKRNSTRKFYVWTCSILKGKILGFKRRRYTHWQPLPKPPSKEEQKSDSIMSDIISESDPKPNIALMTPAKPYNPKLEEESLRLERTAVCVQCGQELKPKHLLYSPPHF